MIATHKRICYDDEGRLECVCRWASPQIPSWVVDVKLPVRERLPERMFMCARGHKVSSTGTPDVCMRSWRWTEPCLLPLEEVTDDAG